MSFPVTLPFLMTTLVVVVTPGTGVIYTLSAGISGGRRASLIAAFGCTLGTVPQLAATIAGLTAVLRAGTPAFQVLRYLGVAYLLYLAWAAIRGRKNDMAGAESASGPAHRVIVKAVLINVLNPKLAIFFFAFLPQFVTPGEPDSVVRMLWLGIVFMLVTFVVFAAYGLSAAGVREHVLARPRVTAWLNRAFACSFVALGVGLAFGAR
ncbi:LysE family translocator [Sphaerimonospora sp. CA-214678]|uniref:LysE family translocator n=1 Tax=Sphaerimonospora sp. CA-214678 TaxID=3240029 RepID=UPI003D933748